MPPKPVWTFPDLPPFLEGLTLDHLSRLRTLIRTHGHRLGQTPDGEIHALYARQPIAVYLVVVGASDEATLIVASSQEISKDACAAIALTPGGPTALMWSAHIPLEGVLDCLDPDIVVTSSAVETLGKKGQN